MLAEIKNLALKTEALETEKKAKASNNGFPINPIDEEEEIDALKFNNQRGGYHSRGNFRGGYQTQKEVGVTEETSEEDTQEVEDNNPTINNLKTTINRTNQHLKEEDMSAKEEVTLRTKTDKIKIRENGVQIAENQPTTQHNAGLRKRSTQ